MRVILFYHSIQSDWNNGNARFLRGVVSELPARGHAAEVFEPALIRRIGRLRRAAGGAFRLLFHDTHHRCFSSPQYLEEIEIGNFDGVLAFGEVLRRHYIEKGILSRAHRSVPPIFPINDERTRNSA